VDTGGTAAAGPVSGIQRVVRESVRRLEEAVRDGGTAPRAAVPVVVTADGMRGAEGFGAPAGPVQVRAGETLLMLDWTCRTFPGFGNVFAQVRSRGGRVLTVVYDLVPLLHPEVVVPSLRELFGIWFRRALLESDGLICISEAVADEVVDYVGRHDLPHRDGLRVGWWHLGADLPTAGGGAVRPALEAFLADPAPVFLMVGTIEPRKRHATALEAMERLWAEGSDARLLLGGRAGWSNAELLERLRDHSEAGRRLLWIDGPSDAEVGRSYAGASALLFPSLYEGYGLPIVEAARHGLGAICSDIPVLREVGGRGPIYVPVDDPAAWARAIGSVARGACRPPDPSATRVLDWEESARQLAEVIHADRWHAILRRRAGRFASPPRAR
jgi:alpha-1,2-rhamnosyltransferase